MPPPPRPGRAHPSWTETRPWCIAQPPSTFRVGPELNAASWEAGNARAVPLLAVMAATLSAAPARRWWSTATRDLALASARQMAAPRSHGTCR